MACLPKVFYSILPSFYLQPHKGMEYGDVSGPVKAGGKTYEMKGIIKKNSENKTSKSVDYDKKIRKPLLSSSKEGQEIIVQVIKDAISTKGPRVTTYLSFPGRFVVLMPNIDHIGVSRKISNEDERNRLKDIIQKTEIKNLYICPSNINLAGAEVELVSMMSREYRMKEKLENGESILEVAKRVKATESEVEVNKVYKILSLDISLEEMRTRLINLFSEESSNRKSYPEIKNYKGLNEFNRMHNNRIFHLEA
jgi:Rne/Rng family ribonuclease